MGHALDVTEADIAEVTIAGASAAEAIIAAGAADIIMVTEEITAYLMVVLDIVSADLAMGDTAMEGVVSVGLVLTGIVLVDTAVEDATMVDLWAAALDHAGVAQADPLAEGQDLATGVVGPSEADLEAVGLKDFKVLLILILMPRGLL